jgi:4-carboxymuconolactone decarboxylase
MVGRVQYIDCMSRPRITDRLSDCLDSFRPDRHVVTRSLAMFSAAITVADEPLMCRAVQTGLDLGASPDQLYETILQSHLFLGFPRMLQAAECLHQTVPAFRPKPLPPLGPDEATQWLERGQELCRRVYNSNYDALKSRVEKMAPEIFLWMELEGYGKVLSRPGLDIVDREMAIVACLMVENREAQLHSHIRGALSVGASTELVDGVIRDLAPLSSEGEATARAILEKLGVVR